MKVITYPDHYQCEVCGTVYARRESAEFCEKQPVIECPHGVGDVVGCITKYDGVEEDIVEEVLMYPCHTGIVSNCKDFDILQSKGLDVHMWAVRVSREHQLGKDLVVTDIIPYHHIAGDSA